MGQITSRRFRRKAGESSSEDKAFSENNIAHKDCSTDQQPWTPFAFSKTSKSVSAVQGLASISVAESQNHVTAEYSSTLKANRSLMGHRSELAIDSRTLDQIHQNQTDPRLTASDVILRKSISGARTGRILEGILLPDDSKVAEVLSQTVTFLSYEIDPILIAEFLQRRPKRNRKCGEELGQGFGVAPGISEEDVSKILSRIISDLNSDEYRSFCDLIRTIGCDMHVLDFLEALDDLLRLMTSGGSNQDTPMLERRIEDDSCECTCSLSSDDERIFWKRTSSSSKSHHSFVDRHFEIRLLYADRESRLAQSFPEVELLKRRKRRRSRLPTVYGRATVIGDTSDRYVPMISVRLINPCLCENQMRRLSRILETKSCIQDLSISETQFDTPAKVRLGHSVGQNIGLFQLDLRGSTLGNDGAMYLASALRRNDSIRVLNLVRTGINGRGCALIVRALSRNRTLIDLDLGSNEVSDVGLRCLSVLIAENCSLRRLGLSSNCASGEGAVSLFLSLRLNSHLQSLDIGNNAIGDDSISVLSEVLILNRTLRDLVLDKCNVSDVGCKAFARALKANMKLRSLNIADNPLTDAGLSALADGIKLNRSLEEADFSGCGITDFGLLQLLDGTRHNATLRSVQLCRNDITLTPRASFPSVPSASHRLWTRRVIETCDTDPDRTGAADAFEIYTRLRQANPNLSIILKENGLTRTVI